MIWLISGVRYWLFSESVNGMVPLWICNGLEDFGVLEEAWPLERP